MSNSSGPGTGVKTSSIDISKGFLQIAAITIFTYDSLSGVRAPPLAQLMVAFTQILKIP
jgi:hypothetical protein